MSRSTLGATDWRGMSLLVGAEATASVCGFLSMFHLARSLGADGFGKLEFATTLVAWWLVLVRGGFDTILIREAAIRPARMSILATVLLAGRIFAALISLVAVWIIGACAGNVSASLMASGLLLVSSLVPDLLARASGHAGILALAQVARGTCVLIWTYFAVQNPADLGWGAAGLVVAEAAVVVTFLLSGTARPRPIPPARLLRLVKRRASRSLPAVSSRFCRVTLYSIDLIVLALLQSDDLGPYAASRRLTFAMLALALVVPSALAGPLAHAFARGTGNARKLVEKATGRILVLTLPPTFGLLLTADGWIPILLGRNFDGAGDWVRVLILRLPVLALSSLFHAAIVASGRDRQVARQGGGLLAIALPAYLLGWHLGGGWGVASAVLAVEILGLIWGYRTADGIGMAPGPGSVPAPLLCGLVAMVAICGLIHPPVVYLQSLWGGIGFGLGWGLASFATTYLRAPSPGRRRPHQSAGAEEDKFRAWHTPVAPRPKRPEPVTLADIEERVA